MGAGALTICHNKAAVQVKEDMKKMVQLPILRPRAAAAKEGKLFGVSLLELRELGLLEDGVPVVVRRMVEHLRKHALHQEGLFRVNGNVRAVETLKQRLESGEDVDFLSEADACTVASLLKQYLRSLPGGLVDSAVQSALIQQHQECSDDGCWSDMRDLLQQLPDPHYSLLRYLCHFLTHVECHHKDNRMTALNLATVFGPNVFHVAPGLEAMKDQNICNKIMAKLIQNYRGIFESNTDRENTASGYTEELPTFIIVKEAHVTDTDTKKSPSNLQPRTPRPVPRKKAGHKSPPDNTDPLNKSAKNPTARPRKKKVRKGQDDNVLQVIPQPSCSAGLPRARSLPIVIPVALNPESRSPSPEAMQMAPTPPAHPDAHTTSTNLTRPDVSPTGSMETLNSSQEEERPISPFYMSNHLSPVHCRPDVANFLNRTIRTTVEQHLFEVNPLGDLSSDDCELTPYPTSPRPTARQRRRHQREQEEGLRHRERSRAASLRAETNKENIPSSGRSSVSSAVSVEEDTGREDTQGVQSGNGERNPKPRKSKLSPTLVQLTDNQDAHALKECTDVSGTRDKPGANNMEIFEKGNDSSRKDGHAPPQTLRMKIQESPVTCDMGRVGSGGVRGSDSECESCEDVPRLDLTALTEDNNWGEPVPAYSSWQRESMDREEARLSPHAGGRLIRQLLEEDSDPMLSPRFYAYGHCQQYLDDTEVPPSPPNAHSFVSRRRSSSLGSCDDEKEELTSAQLTKRIHVLKKKIRKFEEKFEEERKYRPSHSDKAANPEVLRWVNELAKLRKDLKEHKLMKSEEDLPPLTRQRSNTLPKSFGSQLEKKPQQEKAPKPPVESTLEVVLNKLQEKREEVGRPEDIKDMTREQIGAEKVALQKALLHYESIHGRPVTKSERQIMKPLYDRYRLVKQILCRASTIPVIEEEDGSEDDGDSKTQFTVTVRPDLSMLGFLDQMEEEMDGFISPVDELSPSKNTTDMRLSNLHSATMQELVEQLQETREEKKRIRKNLREFEDQFFRQNGRNVQKEDRSPLAVEYNEYKHVKAKLRLLEVLISKRDSTKFI
ncbi:protein FAM13A isoform X2 [Myripristis murdjan]|uniref:protein FAM13A isoform X2 n=1 Tax=Myripristis murdjan TaxID=586833 RepID=UPI0011760684|nr:protein FAM13A isoform X2 [Myripristis murdjan]